MKMIEKEDFDIDDVRRYSCSMPSIFAGNESVDNRAYLNWRVQNESVKDQFAVLGEAYFSASYALLSECLQNNQDKKSDSWIFPIMFGVVHGMEVYLKGINAVTCSLLGRPRSILSGGHDVRCLCNEAHFSVNEIDKKYSITTTKQMVVAIKLVKNFVANIYEKTKDMTFARYPMDKNKSGHFYIESLDNTTVDLHELSKQMILVYKMLDYIYFQLTEIESINAEYHSECYVDGSI